MTDTPLTPLEEDDALAAEYVLGVLPLPERLAVEARLKTDMDLAARVSVWVAHFAPLNEAYASVPVPPDLLPKIESRLFPKASALRGGWRLWLAGTVTAVVGVGVFMLMPPTAPGAVIASLGDGGSALVYEARHDGSHLLVTRVAGTPAPEGQTHELWVIAPGAAPVSLGLLGTDPLDVEYPRPPAGWVLAVSVEPAGGSPTGAPTGPVILTAEL
ncbi:anti-sigma factor [Pseudotabrizicola sp. 4114]|uniref:anti-sigma factor n=1 Tax=Pseudotabrizicola sp. 4114 TaxID=2817731 RepID=UPI0028590850|nr:anti-sigma-K factor RskA [Pseudorhodobacter sp. 4114]